VFLARRPPAAEVTIIGASRGAADDFVRAAARTAGATFGLSRFSLTELAARAAAIHLSGTLRVPGTQAGAEAIAARAVFDAVNADELEYFAPVASMPGFSKALARTLHELRLAGVEGSVDVEDKANADIGRLLARVEEHSLARASTTARRCFVWLPRCAAAAMFDGPRRRWSSSTYRLIRAPSRSSWRPWSNGRLTCWPPFQMGITSRVPPSPSSVDRSKNCGKSQLSSLKSHSL
jgi:hypothetical protein